MRIRNKIWVLVGFLGASFYPEKPVLVDHRGFSPRALTFSVNRMSPAFAALEDVRDLTLAAQGPVDEGEIPSDVTYLGSGQSVGLPPPAPESSLQLSQWEPLAGITIRAQEESELFMEPSPQPAIVLPPADSPEWEALPLDHRRQLLVEKFRQEPIEFPTLSQKLSQVVERELSQQEEITSSFSWPVSPGQEVESSPDHWALSQFEGPAGPSSNSLNHKSPGRGDTLASVDLPGFAPAGLLPEEDLESRILEGRVRMTGGVAYMGEKTQLVVFRQEGAYVREWASVDIEKGSFSLSVERPLGHLVAELHKTNGEILGRGEIDLNLLLAEESSHQDWTDLELLLEPVDEIFKVQALSAYSHGKNKIKVSGAKIFVDHLDLHLETNEEGLFFDPIHSTHSSFLLRAQAADHWETMAMGVVGQRVQDMKLLPNGMVEALISLTAETYGWEVETLRNHAVVWGKVTHKGQPLPGAQVEMAGSPLAEVIYLNEMFLPDHRRSSTSKNGLFAVLMVEPGVHAMRAVSGRVSLPSVLVPADAGLVTYVEMEKGEKRSASLRLVDPFFEEEKLFGQVTVFGSESVLDVHNEAKIVYPSGRGLMMIEADVGRDYEVTRISLPRQVREITLPMIPRQWILDISAQRRINYNLSMGMAVGFIEGDDFEVFLEEDVLSPASEILYFDQEGHLLNRSHGVAGGGFVLLNLPLGLHQISVLPKTQNVVFTQVVVSEGQTANILKHNFQERP